MASASSKPVVYVVDDDDAVRDSLDTYLTLKGLHTVAFGSARDVLAYRDFGPELLIVDINMPDIDGFALLDALRERGQNPPVILITGLGDPEVRARADRAEVAALFDKPIDAPALLTAIKRILERI
jgi:FixJ family two-component response regulator